MRSSLARDALKVVSSGDELPGVIVYGLTARATPASGRFPRIAWPELAAFDERILRGAAWEVSMWELALTRWPEGGDWTRAIRETLGALIAAGCRASWIGAEGVPFCDPPQLFDPTCMSGGVLAWMTSEAFDCGLRPDRELVPVSDETLGMLRSYARGLADVA